MKPIHFIVPSKKGKNNTQCGLDPWITNFKYTHELNDTTCKRCIAVLNKIYKII